MTIANDKDLDQALVAQRQLILALAALKREVPASTFPVLAEGTEDEIRKLRSDIDAYLNPLADDCMWIRVTGPTVELGSTPTSIVTMVLDVFRKSIQAVAEYSLRGELSTRPSAALKHAVDFRIAGFAPGSLRVALRLPAIDQLSMATDELPRTVVAAIEKYVAVARWAAGDAGDDALESTTENIELRRLLLAQVGQLVPRSRGAVETVELSGKFVGSEPVVLRKITRDRIGRALDRTEAEAVETHTGDLREIDLDKLSFVLRHPSRIDEIPCSFPENLREVAKSALDRTVRVSGVRTVEAVRRHQPLRVTRLDVLEDESAD